MTKALLLGPLLALGLLGCGGPDFQTLCEDQEACYGGNDADIEACVIQAELYFDLYDDIGCGDKLEASVECSADTSSCHNQPSGQPCMTSAECNGNGPGSSCVSGQCNRKVYGPTADDACDVEQKTVNRCSDLD